MRIIGHGIDMESEENIGRYLRRERWAERIFSPAERELAGINEARHAYFFAGRFAGKEAVAKALGTGFSEDVRVDGIEILKLPTDAPFVRLNGSTLAYATSLGVTGWFISISHRSGLAIASAIAVGD